MLTETQAANISETRGCKDHDHDLLHELSRRLDSLFRCDRYIANATGFLDLQRFWQQVKAQEQEKIQELKKLLVQHIEMNCF